MVVLTIFAVSLMLPLLAASGKNVGFFARLAPVALTPMIDKSPSPLPSLSNPQLPASSPDTATARALNLSVDADGFPPAAAWKDAAPVRFNTDWQGRNPDPQRETEVQILWSPTSIYLKFICRYRVITIFSDASQSGRRDQLWDRDVAEVFLQPDSSDPYRYKEFEVSPNGFWIDLDISHGQLESLQSGLQRRVRMNESQNDDGLKTWSAELAIPMRSLTHNFDSSATWRVNFFRVEGPAEPRFYSAWRSTNTPRPNFHVPERFGYLKFAPANR